LIVSNLRINALIFTSKSPTDLFCFLLTQKSPHRGFHTLDGIFYHQTYKSSVRACMDEID
jgi:hypothetical protein